MRTIASGFCAAALLALGLAGCASTDRARHAAVFDAGSPAQTTSFDAVQLEALGASEVLSARGRGRLLVRGGRLGLSVSDPQETSAEVGRRIEAAGGYVEQSDASEEYVSLRNRVPSERLDALMDELAELGEVERRSVSADDVTDQVADLETRLRNDRALRDRLNALLERADDVEDVLALEKELNRLQSQIETMQGQLERLEKDVAMSLLVVDLEQSRILGPLGYVGAGLVWALSKLFVIR